MSDIVDRKGSEQTCQFDIDVVEHEIDGDFASLESHIFTLEIWLHQEPYRVRRSYKDICEFDSRLNKQYPKTNLPPCPFSTSGSSLLPGNTERKGGIRESLVNLKNNARESIAIVGRRGSQNDINPDELVSKKKPALLSYLKLLLDIPEIVRSANMLDFLDKASVNGEAYEEVSVNLMEMLLEGNAEKSVNIMKKHSVKFEVQAGEYIVWKFSTKNKDLGFSIDINDDNVLTYQRHNCHERPIENVLRVPVSGTARLLWDNSYSKLRTKHLMFRCKVLTNELYKQHSKHCVDTSREQQANHSRRAALQRELVLKAHLLLSSQSGRLMSQDFTVDMTSGDKVVHEDLQSEIKQLRNEKSSLQMALSESEIALADIRQELVTMKKKLDKNNTMAEELQRVSGERDELQQELLDESMAKKKLQIDLQAVRGELAASGDQLEAQQNQNQAGAHALATLQHQQTLLHDENSRLMDEISQLKTADRSGSGASDAAAQIQRLKGEKKQLKAYAIGLKTQIEEAEREKKSEKGLESDQKVARGLVQKMTPLLGALERELAALQSLRGQYCLKLGLDPSTGAGSSDGLVAATTGAVERGMNTADNASMMLEYASMKLSAISIDTSISSTPPPPPPPDTFSPSTPPSSAASTPSKPVPEHSGSVYGAVISSPRRPSSSSSSSSSPMRGPGPSDHPPACPCMRCRAPPKKPSMMESVINTLLDGPDSGGDKRKSSVTR